MRRGFIDGVAFLFLIAYALLMLAAGRGRELHPLLYLFAALFVLRYAWLTRVTSAP